MLAGERRDISHGEQVAVIRIVKVDDSMFEEAYELLLGLNGTGISKEVWRRLLRPQWRLDGMPCGLGLVDRGRLVGFVGTLFSERVIDGRVERFCNLSSLIVSEAYRRHGWMLMFSAVRAENCTITIFTPMSVLYTRAPEIGFRNLGARFRIMFPVPWARRARGVEVELLDDPMEIRPHLDETHRRYLDDHLPYECGHLLVRQSMRYCYVVHISITSAKLPYALILYVSDPELFAELSIPIRAFIMGKSGMRFVAVDSRLIRDLPLRASFDLPSSIRRLYKPDRLSPHQVDNLYSEFVLLRIGATASLGDMIRSAGLRWSP
jgi:hypothetical protein